MSVCVCHCVCVVCVCVCVSVCARCVTDLLPYFLMNVNPKLLTYTTTSSHTVESVFEHSVDRRNEARVTRYRDSRN